MTVDPLADYRRIGRARIDDNPDDPRHGTANGYSNLKCRCDRCRAAWRIVMRPLAEAYRRRRGQKPMKYGRTHGLVSTYNDGCRCDECRESARQHRARMRAQAKQRLAS